MLAAELPFLLIAYGGWNMGRLDIVYIAVVANVIAVALVAMRAKGIRLPQTRAGKEDADRR
jgi:hypothetical protein